MILTPFYYFGVGILSKVFGYFSMVYATISIVFLDVFCWSKSNFSPMYFLGLAGMLRRIPNYPDAFSIWNSFASLGSMKVGSILVRSRDCNFCRDYSRSSSS
jgi:heme/copper-type cytochrome/quinol oxidase subunit 1